ncbi:MAG: thioredoxin [Candidatus Bathyarchaeia archaeon]
MNSDDGKLERIKRRKIEELMRMFEEKSSSVSKPIEVTDFNFNETIRRNRLVVIDCWAPWCAPCRMMTPIIDELAREYSGKILFGKLNVNENQKTSVEYQIMSIPTFLVFKDGYLIEKIVGAMPKKALEQKLVKYLES